MTGRSPIHVMSPGYGSNPIFQPEWTHGRNAVLHFGSPGWWNLYAERNGKIVPVFELEAEIGVPQWLFGYSRYAFLSASRVACIYSNMVWTIWHVVDTGS